MYCPAKLDIALTSLIPYSLLYINDLCSSSLRGCRSTSLASRVANTL